MKTTIAIIVSIIILTGTAHANDPVFRGFGWGIGKESFSDQVEYVRDVLSVYTNNISSVYRVTEEGPVFGGVTVEGINLEFYNNKMTSITVKCKDDKQFIEISSLMRTVIGEPEVKNSFMKWTDTQSYITADPKKLTIRLVDREHREREIIESKKRSENKIETYKQYGF